MTSPLLDSVLTELRARRGDWPALCRETGLSYWWLIKFGQGRINEPGILKVQRLSDYFAVNPRNVGAGGTAADQQKEAA